ncbi:hypothetical protein [Gracilibacillus timonensis]|uniref:hypothetical protein n=1 Tax=Gracilibacillus timonensis TaxID=1816696 RepID=UPI000ABD7A8A|nr:hypothetical protein [Gracilibacillus timonensis]
MNLFNHYSFGAVVAWMYMHSLGIQRDPKQPAAVYELKSDKYVFTAPIYKPLKS